MNRQIRALQQLGENVGDAFAAEDSVDYKPNP
jgi:hypothetical protein